MEGTRVDAWLWAVRLFRTRSAAAAACRAGHVRVNGRPAKPATSVAIGDEVRARVGDRERIVEVARLISTRVGAPIAVECYVDHSPAPEPADSSAPTGRRERGAGRPTKRDRREIDRLRGRDSGP
jgi:ribosome-associated heat shock protein Hsp15